MKGIVIKATNDMGIVNDMEIVEISDVLRDLQKAVGGHIEIVHPMRLERPYVMVVNEEGRLQGLPMNAVGSRLYGMDVHGQTIVGDAVILKEGIVNGEPDLVGLTDAEALELSIQLTFWVTAWQKKRPARRQPGQGQRKK